LDLLGAAQVEVLTQDFLEELPALERALKDVRGAHLKLNDRELVSVAGRPVRGGKGMRQAAHPFAEEGVHVRCAEPVAERLAAVRIGDRQDPVVEGLIGNPSLGELAFDPLVTIKPDADRERQVGAELDEGGPEVAIQQVEIEMLDADRLARPAEASRGGLGARNPRMRSWAMPMRTTPSGSR
jgi:hypothetical protein